MPEETFQEETKELDSKKPLMLRVTIIDTRRNSGFFISGGKVKKAVKEITIRLHQRPQDGRS